MSTRGFIGYRTTKRKDTTDNVFGIYNNFGSYFTGIGLDVLKIYNNNPKENFIAMFKSKTWNKSENILIKDTLGVFDLSKESVLVKDTLSVFKVNKEKFVNDSNFLLKGEHCQYAYIYNIKTDELEVYESMNNKPYFKNQPINELNEYLNLAFVINRENIHLHLVLFHYSLRLGDDVLIRIYMKDIKNNK
ncbi:hypothetical protein ACTPEW_16015 [Clostridioides difficile]